MSEIRDCFCKTLDKSSMGIGVCPLAERDVFSYTQLGALMARMLERLKITDLAVSNRLEEQQVIIPTIVIAAHMHSSNLNSSVSDG